MPIEVRKLIAVYDVDNEPAIEVEHRTRRRRDAGDDGGRGVYSGTVSKEVDDMAATKTFTLMGADGRPYASDVKGKLGGVLDRKLYGTLECKAADRAITSGRGTYEKNRVFFLDEETAVAAGYRPCAVCLPDRYASWKATQPK